MSVLAAAHRMFGSFAPVTSALPVFAQDQTIVHELPYRLIRRRSFIDYLLISHCLLSGWTTSFTNPTCSNGSSQAGLTGMPSKWHLTRRATASKYTGSM